MDKVVIVGEAIAGQNAKAREVRKRLMYLTQNIDENTFDLAELLADARKDKLYSVWGYASITDYGAKELNIKKRRTQYLIRIVETCRAVGLKREQYERAGVTKLREITVLDYDKSFYNTETKENEPLADHIVRLILAADEMTSVEVSQEVSRLMGLEGPEAIITRSHKWSKSTYENVIKLAIERVRLRLGSKRRDEDGNAVEYSDSECLELICAEFNADPNNFEPDVPVEEPTISKLEIATEDDVSI